jgi:predicted MFS family arabinose efflux permease
MISTPSEAGWTRRLIVLAVSAAVAVSVIYLPQPLLPALAAALHVPIAAAAAIATGVQIGYAVGIFLLVPLSERAHPRRQITIQILILALALVVTAFLDSVAAVAIGFLAVGLVANIAQLVIPAAVKLSPPARRGGTTTTLVGALLCGIFGGRIVTSLLVGLIGWRWDLIVFAALVLATLPFVRAALGGGELPLSALGTSYPRLLASTLRLVVESRSVRESALMQFFSFAAFNALWSIMSLHLGSVFGWSGLGIALFGVLGLAAGLVTPISGRFVDRFGGRRVAGAFAAIVAAAILATVFDSHLAWLFAVSTFVWTWANQSMQAAGQNWVLVSNPNATARANTLFMVVVFFGGAFGSYLGPVVYAAGGVPAVALAGVALLVLSFLAWALSFLPSRRREQLVAAA